MMLIDVVWQDECSRYMVLPLQYRMGSGGGLPVIAACVLVGAGLIVAGSVLHLVRTIGATIAASMALLMSKRGLPIEECTHVE